MLVEYLGKILFKFIATEHSGMSKIPYDVMKLWKAIGISFLRIDNEGLELKFYTLNK